MSITGSCSIIFCDYYPQLVYNYLSQLTNPDHIFIKILQNDAGENFFFYGIQSKNYHQSR